jgi:hypothetical protein
MGSGLAGRAQDGDGGDFQDDGHRGPLASVLPAGLAKRTSRPAPARPRLMNINRDWPIPVDCRADGVTVRNNLQHFSLEELARAKDNPLFLSVQQLIARRQARVADDEPPYRPLLHFYVHADGLRAYYLAYPALGPLGVPMTREDLDPEEEVRSHRNRR